jgi:hypothetical protein
MPEVDAKPEVFIDDADADHPRFPVGAGYIAERVCAVGVFDNELPSTDAIAEDGLKRGFGWMTQI